MNHTKKAEKNIRKNLSKYYKKKNIMFIVPIFILLISCDNGTAQAESKSKVKKDSKINTKTSKKEG